MQKNQTPRVIRLPVSNISASQDFMTSSDFYDLFWLQRKNRDGFDLEGDNLECSISVPENEPPLKKTTLKKSIADRKLELLPKCAELMTQLPPDEKSTKMLHFALFVEKKLSRLSIRNRMVANKRIMDAVFEIEISTFKENEREVPVSPSGTATPMPILLKIEIFFIRATVAVPPIWKC